MKLLRSGGEYLASKERRLWIVTAVVVVVVGVIVLVVQVRALWIFLLLAMTMIVGKAAIRRLERVRSGRFGERLVVETLKHLSDDYWLLNDLTLEPGRGNVDHVLIGPCGIVVIETKRITGTVRCSGDDWYINGRPGKSISRQVKAAARSVQRRLIDRHPELKAEIVQHLETVIVFTHPRCELQIKNSVTEVVVHTKLVEHVQALAKRHRMAATVGEILAAAFGPGHHGQCLSGGRWAV
jgi:hypothetical protein